MAHPKSRRCSNARPTVARLRPATAASASPLQRTRCSLAVLMALGAIGGPGVALAAPPGTILPANTLPVLRGLVSQYAGNATFNQSAVAGGGGQVLTINQLTSNLILNWNQFNIANGSVVQFVQPSATSAVLNRIYDQNPSIIQGQIKANGQVYLVNQNGILFDRGAQVNVNTLVASTLNISDTLFGSGLTTNNQSGLTTPTLAGGYDSDGKSTKTTPTGHIVIGANGLASAAAPAINSADGGAIVIVAPVINNQSGVITSPDGQVILAAGNAAYLGFSAVSNNSLRGMLVQVTADNAPVNLSSLISNSGSISADRGNVTLAALAINQAGRVSASSAMIQNGSVYLQANTFNNAQTGSVTLAAGSVTATPLDLSDTTTLRASDKYTPYQSVVQITGALIDNEGQITSPAGLVTLNALNPASPGDARIYLGAGSVIDASGAWSTASAASNLLTFKVTSNELQNAPDQKNGVLQGATVTVNLAQGSTVLDLSGYQAAQAQTLAQKAAVGGTVTLSSTGSLIERTDATVNVSGGGVDYSAATLATTQLLGANGKAYDIATAPEAQAYTGIANSFTQTQSRWGYSQTYDPTAGSGVYQPAYVQGAAAGTVQISMESGLVGSTALQGLVLDGKLLGGVTVGSRQLGSAPAGGTLNIGDSVLAVAGKPLGIGNVAFEPGVLSSLPAGFSATTALASSSSARSQLDLSTAVLAPGSVDAAGNYVSQGFGTVNVYADGSIAVPAGVVLQGPIGGTLNLHSSNQVQVNGSIAIPAGSLSAVATNGITLGAGASIDTSGAWINSVLGGATSPVPTGFLNAAGSTVASSQGGSISLSSQTLNLGAGSMLDVSAGGGVSAKGVISGGAGGAIVLNASGDAALTLDGSLLGEGTTRGGTLSLSTGSGVRVGAGTDTSFGLNLDPGFFASGGFQGYSISAGNLEVAAGTAIQPQASNLQLNVAQALALPTGASATEAGQLLVLPANLRSPTNLSLSSQTALSLQSGASITADPGASIALAGKTSVSIDGAVSAPGGSIAVSMSASADPQPTTPLLELGSQGSLSTRGTFVATPNNLQLTQGTLYAGGKVSLSASAAAIQLDPGSTIDVSGASQVLNLLSAPGSATPYSAVLTNSNAGSLSISANDSVSLSGALLGQAAGSAAGGSFSLSLAERGDLGDPTSQRRIVVTSSGAPVAALPGFKDAAISINKLSGGGFDLLSLQSEDQIFFAGSTALNFMRGLSLNTQQIQVADGAAVLLGGAKVTLANTIGQRVPASAVVQNAVLDPTLPSLPQATLPGSGSFSVAAGTLDVIGSVTISGTQSESLVAANDIQLSGRAVGNASSAQGAALIGGLVTAGNLLLQAAQIYPTTASTFQIAVADGLTGVQVPGGRIDISAGSGGNAGSAGTAGRGAVYSAGGSLTIAADTINQNGVVLAPLGQLSLQAGSSLVLGSNSVSSVSANGLTIPYGETQAGVTWTYQATGSNPATNALTAPPSKQLTLSAPSVNLKTGASVDISGGGDVAAFEFVSGSGGTTDVLAQPNTYAILPAANLASLPISADPLLAQNSGLAGAGSAYNSIRIGAGGPLPAGTYLLLPANYALLPGGYMVQLLSGSSFSQLYPGQTTSLANGLTVVPGVLTATGTSVAAAMTVGVVVRPNSAISTLADYTVTDSAYFSTLAAANRAPVPLLPTDGGQLSIAASQALTLQGALVAKLPGASARSAEVDIAATKIALVGAGGDAAAAAGYLQIDTTSLSTLDASLLIGGVRSNPGGLATLTPTATNIIVANSSSSTLTAPELILAATQSISIESGSSIQSSGSSGAPLQDLTIAGPNAASGALIRVASTGLINFDRPAATGQASAGTVNIASGATISTSGSLTIDATLTTSSAGTLAVAQGGALSLVSGQISLGDTSGLAATTSGLVLDNAQLAGFNQLGTLSLKSYGGIDLYGSAIVGSNALQNLVMDGASLTGHASAAGAPAAAQIAAANVDLVNSSGTSAAGGSPSPGSGNLVVSAGQITLDAGAKSLSGFAGVQLDASNEIVAAGSGSLVTASPLLLQAARIGSQSGATQTWSAIDASNPAGPVYLPVTINAVTPATALADSTALGSRLTVIGSSIADAGTITMKGGAVTLQALGSSAGDGVQLTGTALIDAGGASQNFQGAVAYANAGQVTLQAPNGAVTMAPGTAINVAAAAGGGDAGTLSISALGASLGGTLGGASSSGAPGSFSLDVGSLADFSSLNAQLAAAGFAGTLNIRVRSGDLTVAAGDVVKAQQLVLASDSGTLDVKGRIDASATLGGGSVALYGQNLQLESGSTIDSSATSTQTGGAAPAANGGTVTAAAEGGSLGFAGVIDVSGGASGSAGSVVLRAPRTSTDQIQATLTGTVLSQSHGGSGMALVAVEGNQVYRLGGGSTTVKQAMIDGWANDNLGFMTAVAAPAIAAGIRGDGGGAQGNVQVRPAVEVQAAGDLTIASNWDLTAPGWLTQAPGSTKVQAGSLEVRAAGNLTLASASVGNPDDTLQPTATWNIALSSGADLKAANPLQTQSLQSLAAQAASGQAGPGDLVLDSNTAAGSIRTGSGNIQLAAGRDFAIQTEGGTDPNTGNPLIGVVYTSGMAAIKDPLLDAADGRFAQGGGNISISAGRNAVGAGNEWMTEWFRAVTNIDNDPQNGLWFALRQNFQDGAAALGGGNVSIAAGNDINHLSAWVPTSALMVTSASIDELQALGSGAVASLQVYGGGDLSVRAGNDIVGGQYMASLGTARMVAGGNVGSAASPTEVYVMGASTVPASGQSIANVSAGGSVTLAGINNPGALYQTPGALGGPPGFDGGSSLSYLSYASASAAHVQAEGGDLTLGAGPVAANLLPVNAGNESSESAQPILPAQVALTAFSGSIVNSAVSASGSASQAVMFPSTSGSLNLLARKDIVGMNVDVSDVNPLPFASYLSNGGVIDASLLVSTVSSPSRLNTNDSKATYINNVVALGGSIVDPIFTFPTRSQIWAADDIVAPTNLNGFLSLQNLAAGDTSQVVANTGSVFASASPITISGPGNLLIQAGQNVDIGSAPIAQLISEGNQINASLTNPAGATITLLAGVSGPVSLSAIGPTFDALVAAGKANDTAAAATAVDALFASAQVGKGDINSYLTSVQSNAGAPINLLAPGGNITVGLTTSDPNKVGLVTNAGGAINSYLSGDFDINRGKVITAQGGDITIYTSEGSIDAGRGAKTAVTTPPPTRVAVIDPNTGNVTGYTYTLPAAVAGSGIQTATSKPGGPNSVAPKAGSINLFAPAGTINAGEAGITSAGNIFISALTVLNASNISASGTSTGVPQVAVGSVAATLASSGATTSTDTSKDTQIAAQAAAAAAQAAAAAFKPNILTVEVLGFGDKNCKEQDKDCFAK